MKYLPDGRACEVVAELPDGRGVVVDLWYEGDDEPSLQDDLIIVPKVLDQPLNPLIEKNIKERRQLLDEMVKQLNDLRAEVATAKMERDRILDKLKQIPALKRIEDFLDGKITHVVSRQYGRIHITPIGEMICDSDRDYRCKPAAIKLMTLYGEQPGNLLFRVNQYKDGSGSSGSEYEAFPCCSEEEAKQQAGRLIDEQIQDSRQYYLEESVKSADKIGHPVPDALREVIRMNNLEKHRSQVEEARKRLHEAEQLLLKIGGSVPALQTTAAAT